MGSLFSTTSKVEMSCDIISISIFKKKYNMLPKISADKIIYLLEYKSYIDHEPTIKSTDFITHDIYKELTDESCPSFHFKLLLNNILELKNINKQIN